MNKTAIKNFAVWARQKLIADITYKASLLGITENAIAEKLPQSTKDLQFFDIGTKEYVEVAGSEIEQRNALVSAIKKKEKDNGDYKSAFEYVVEEVAYTWFNRLIAIRFMEVNDYLPSGIRVLSSENAAKNEPDFVTSPFDTDLEFTTDEQDKIIRLKDENKWDELFRMLFIKQCNKLYDILPELFEQTDDYSELLLTISFTDKDGVVYRLVHDIDEDDFNVEKEGQVEIIGWMYQYYNSEKKDDVFAALKKNVKITKENIPAATQLFTPDWIVRYMVENSLGRLWLEGHPNAKEQFLPTEEEQSAYVAGNRDLEDTKWHYYLEEAEQEANVHTQLEEIRKEYATLTPDQLKVIDPCSGSGHILVYMFDVLMKIYESYGYTTREAVASIVKNNLYSLDIDDRAAQMAYFAVMMKARQYDRRFFSRGIQPHVYAIVESNHIDKLAVDYFCNGDMKLTAAMDTIISELHDAKEYGSILTVTPQDWSALYDRFAEITEDINMSRETALRELLPLVQVAEVLAQKYDVVVTNPPYMGNNGFSSKMSEFAKKYYNEVKTDLFAMFMIRCKQFTKKNGFQSMITQHSWMFLSSYEWLRSQINRMSIASMAHLGTRAFDEISGEMVSTSAFCIRNVQLPEYGGKYQRLVEYHGEKSKEAAFLTLENIYKGSQISFEKIPGMPIAYWVSENVAKAFEVGNNITDYVDTFQGIITGDNDKFLRYWHEVSCDKIPFHATNMEKVDLSRKYWIPYNKGGEFRKWYGVQDYVVYWKKGPDDKTRGKKGFSNYYLRKYVAWSYTISNSIATRIYPEGFLWDVRGSGIMDKSNMLLYLEGLISSEVGITLFRVNNSTLSCQVENIIKLPIILDNDRKNQVDNFVEKNNNISKLEWDSFEVSWDFQQHPLLHNVPTIAEAFDWWQTECDKRFNQLKANEEELNRIFIDIYGLQDELKPEVEDKDVTIRKADLQRDIKSLISYAVGCMFGRYSLDTEGLAYAGGDWDDSKYETFIPDEDNCIPITDEEYFEDDIVGLFCAWLKKVYGEDTLEENLDFIANALGNKGKTSREVIRNYFLNDFIKDHIKTYQKRPIYWLFDSGKQNGFKALVYMHRWNADTTGNMRVEYLHRMQRVYEKEMERMQEIIDNSHDNKEINNATKRKEKLQKQYKETKDYDAKVAHLALSRIDIDLDDGVKVNYEKVQTADGKKMQILAKI